MRRPFAAALLARFAPRRAPTHFRIPGFEGFHPKSPGPAYNPTQPKYHEFKS